MSALARYARPFRPPLLARGGHAQTILGHLLPSRGARIADGVRGWSSLDVALEPGESLRVLTREGTSGVRVLLLHGLGGDANSDYVRRAADRLGADGHSIWAVNHRGCGAGSGLAREPYHSGRVEDLGAVLAASRARGGAALHVAVGFSLSGNLVLLHAGLGLAPAPDALIAVNPPVDLAHASYAIGRGLNRAYELRFLVRLGREVRRRKRAGGLERVRDGVRPRSLVEFDELVTAPQCGFRGAADYYARCSAAPHLARVAIPGVLLTSDDDPFVRPEALAGFDGSASLAVHRAPGGGHVGYLGEGWARGERWLDGALSHYVTELARVAAERSAGAPCRPRSGGAC